MKTKTIFLFIAAVVAMGTTISCDKEDLPILFTDLPSSAQNIITTYFDQDEITLITIDREIFDKEYTVLFKDGTIIDFNRDGEWDNIESKIEGVPMEIIPTTIAEYLETNYANQMVVEIDKENNGYDIELDNRVELKFNSAGSLTGAEID